MTRAEKEQLDRIEIMLTFLLEAKGVNLKNFWDDQAFEKSKRRLQQPTKDKKFAP